MHLRSVPMFALLAACNGGDKTSTLDDGPTDTPTVETADSGDDPELDLTGQVGSIVIGHWPDDAYFGDYWWAGGIFLEDDQGIDNLAACQIWVGACYADYPTDDTPIAPASFTLGDTIDAGSTVEAGGVTLGDEFYSGIVFYVGEPTGFGSSGDLSLDGDLAPFDGTDVFGFPDDIVVTAPDPASSILARAGETLDLAWTSPGAGDVFLESLPGVPYSYADPQLRRLDDVGSYGLAIDSLGMVGPLDARVLLLSRMVNTPVDAGGNTIQVQTRSDQWLYLNYADPPIEWVELTAGANAGEACSDALLVPPVGTGTYWGNLSAALNDHDLGYGNSITGFESPGPDVVVPVALTAGQTLSVAYTLTTRDGSVYLLDASCDLGNAIVGSDAVYYYYPEEFQHTATADETVYVVGDGYLEGFGGTYRLDLDIQ